MATFRTIITRTALALALTLGASSLATAAVIIGSDYESGRVPEAAVGVRLPAGFHMNVTNGDDYLNLTMALPEGAKGEALIERSELGGVGHLGPVIGSDWENAR